MFSPRSIAIIGASSDPNKLNGLVLKLLIERGYKGKIFPVNPKYREIAGLPCYPDVAGIDSDIDMAVLVAPAHTVPQTIEELGRKGVGTAVVISSGFAEVGEQGRVLERRAVEIAKRHKLRLLGPNTIGFINAFDRIAVTFTAYAEGEIPAGPIAIVSQSGAFGSGMSAMARRRGLGVGYFIATGNEADLDLADALEAVLDDPRIEVVGGYVEGLSSGLPLLRVAEKALKLGKPLVLAKVGRSQAGARAAASHTGALAVEDAVFDGIARQYGILRARNEEHLLDVLQALSFCRALRGRGIGVVTASGGAGVMIADRAADVGLELPALSGATRERLKALVPSYGSLANPVDVSGQLLRNMPALKAVLLAVLDDPAIDVGMMWTQMLDEQAEALVETFRQVKEIATKPFVVCWVAASDKAIAGLHAHGIAAFRGGEPAVDAIAAVARYVETRKNLPTHPPEIFPDAGLPRQGGAVSTVQGAALLARAGVPVARALFAPALEDAAAAAKTLGYPVALKIESPDILHKTEVGGIRLSLKTEPDLRLAHDELMANVRKRAPGASLSGVIVQEMIGAGVELVVGLQNNPTFGLVVMVGMGGILVEVLRDVSFRKAPVSVREADAMLDELRTRAILDGVRGRPAVNRKAVAELISAVSRFGAAHSARLRELDLNPVVATPGGVVAVDWLMVLEEASQ